MKHISRILPYIPPRIVFTLLMNGSGCQSTVYDQDVYVSKISRLLVVSAHCGFCHRECRNLGAFNYGTSKLYEKLNTHVKTNRMRRVIGHTISTEPRHRILRKIARRDKLSIITYSMGLFGLVTRKVACRTIYNKR